jgi:hypothetical protein
LLLLDEFVFDPAAEVSPPEALFGACDEADAEGEGETEPPAADLPPFSFERGSAFAGPAL